MAERIVPVAPEPAPYAPRVDWPRFADGAEWELTRGVDFEQRPAQAADAWRNWCRRHGLRGFARVLDSRSIRIAAYVVGPTHEDVRLPGVTHSGRLAECEFCQLALESAGQS